MPFFEQIFCLSLTCLTHIITVILSHSLSSLSFPLFGYLLLINSFSEPLPVVARDVYVHFPLVTRGNMDGEGQVDLSKTKGRRNKSKKRKFNLQGKTVIHANTPTDPHLTNTIHALIMQMKAQCAPGTFTFLLF